MEALELLQAIRLGIENVEKKGVKSVPTRSLLGYLDQISASVSKVGSQPKLPQHAHELFLQMARLAEEERAAAELEGFKAVIGAGQNALKMALIIHTGATLAILTLVGHLATHPSMYKSLSENPEIES